MQDEVDRAGSEQGEPLKDTGPTGFAPMGGSPRAGRLGGDDYSVLRRLLLLAFGLVILLWLVYMVRELLVLVGFALVLGIVLNAPVVWLEERGLPRWAGATVVLLAVVVTVGLVGWLVVPVLVEDVVKLAGNAPDYLDALAQRLAALTKNVPALSDKLDLSGRSIGDFLPPLGSIVTRIGRYTFTVLGVLVIGIVLLGIVLYLLFDPAPSYRAYLLFTPAAHQDRAQRAFIAGSQAAVGWVWSNVVVGVVEAVIVGLFLWLIGVPGAFVWGAFAFIAELVPVLGAYLMAIPPLLVALSIRPLLALWVFLFYLIFNPLKDHIAFPLVRRTTMQLNPVFLLFVTVAAAQVFGLIGALISAPLAGFIKAYYEEFYLGARQQDEVSQQVEEMVRLDEKSANPPDGDG